MLLEAEFWVAVAFFIFVGDRVEGRRLHDA